ncbi:RNA helicase-related protein required for pre-mRNA splicing [Suhomyces tanzawaensis NRRL Y-17324]|uniref:RNA helicase-related protein required for pre-mRNA splicing n=1 Tax=Suhomyces tanzawaensis NRRL Y-17324 TaxID=984487 RepID=A0A1E4SLY3_9ASCO|nr:RNA helicase-related protein required for pre-mRNA splicing [Suhomyces tanzawaensis NRRL Y-17324]ODV80536.1 RNA helicase-related protein required for pre-mRNA splicing [Suhomyces tanzawaensis NRRL Y-17324]
MDSSNKQYSYDEMSNKVIRSDRRGREEVNTNPSSLVGQISVKDMGTRVARDSPKDQTEIAQASKTKRANAVSFNNYSYSSTYENISYHPTNEDTAHFFDLIMTQVRHFLPDTSHEVILSAADTILEIIKGDGGVLEKKTEVSDILDAKVSDVQLNDLINLANRITDYAVEEIEEEDGDEGVAVVFDESEAEDIPEEDDEDDQDEPQEEEDAEDAPRTETVLQSTTTTKKSSTILPLHEIDLFYLQRKLTSIFENEDPAKIQSIHNELSTILGNREFTSRDVENELMELMDYDHFDFVKLCTENRWRIHFKIMWLKVMNDEKAKEKIILDLEGMDQQSLASELSTGIATGQEKKRKLSDSLEPKEKKTKPSIRTPKIVDLEAITFDQGSHLMATRNVKLPEGSYQQTKKSYDTIRIPPPVSPPIGEGESLVPITDLPEWARQVFPSSETSSLNRIQSKVYPLAFGSDENLLLCAPTGAGKTNVAMLTVLRAIENYRDPISGKINLNQFKIVYIAPLKALVQEQMREFERRLTPTFGIVVNELTGDSSLSKQQIDETQILVTTPEKWDIITRKSADLSSTTALTKLIIIDEIHLLHDERGPVLESIVSRTHRYQETTGEAIRLVGLSATLPNYQDVAQFLRVKKGLFYFDSSYRPCPLAQQFIGIKEKKAIKKLNAMNEACHEKLIECMKNNHQLIIFVHSRKDTFKTANWLKEKLESSSESELVLKPGSGSAEILKQEAEAMKNRNLRDIIPSGFGIHHAGLDKEERSVVEDLFAQGHIKVLVSTATLAWGVNLPAHTVVIKGTETYSPEKGSWVQLSPQDILQMLGRAGRPRYDKSGEGIIITSHDELQYYLAILNQQLPIESQFVSKLVDNLNAEVVLGTVRSLKDATEWLGYTYLYIRMLKSPALYHVGAEYDGDKTLELKRTDLVHTALTILDKNKLVDYNKDSGEVRSTELGKIASHYYINYPTMNMYNSKLKPWLTEIEILKIFASSGEFKFIPVRQEEKLEVSKLLERCPIPIKESPNDPLAKVNVLLQSYISKLSLEGFALMADMIYITQSAGRLLRGIFEIVFKKGWSALAKTTLNLCKMVEKRLWLSSSPFRQFGDMCPREIVRVTESSHLPFVSYFNLNALELSEALNLKGSSQVAYDLIQQFPKLELNYYSQPITSTTLRVQVEIVPTWNWSKIHGNSQSFYVIVEDCDGDKILYNDHIQIKKEYAKKEHFLDFSIDMLDPQQPNYFITFISDRWLHSEWKIPLQLTNLKFPKKVSHTEVLDLQNVPTTSLPDEFKDVFQFNYFNKFQSQAFASLFNSNENVLIGLAKGGGKTVCAELAILNHWNQNKGRVVYINPVQEKVDRLTKVWTKKFNNFEKEVQKLTGDVTKDLAILNSSHLVLATPQQYHQITKRWRQRKVVKAVELLVCDDLHMLSNPSYANYEVSISRMRLISSQFGTDLRIVALSSPLFNSRDIGEWLGCSKHNIFNFDPSNRFNYIDEIRLLSSDNQQTFMNWGLRNCWDLINLAASSSITRTLIFLSTRKQCIDVGSKLLQLASGSASFLKVDVEDLQPYLDRISDPILSEFLNSGIAIYHPGMNSTDKLIVEKLFENDLISILLSSKETCFYSPSAPRVIIFGTEEYEGKEHRLVDYTVNEVIEMIGCCVDPISNKGKVTLLTNQNKLKFFQEFLGQGLPVESYLNASLHDQFIDEISAKNLKSNQDCIDWITYTYFYRRIRNNPNFYDVKDTSGLGISEYLSELIENTMKDLSEAELVDIEEDEDEEETFSPTNGSLISSHYNVPYASMNSLNKLNNRTKIGELIETLCSSSEFEVLKIRDNEPLLLNKIYNKLPIKYSNPKFESPYVKAFILLQAHMLRIPLSFELLQDKKIVIKTCLNLIAACVDTLSSQGYLSSIQVIDLSQMIVQAVWFKDSPLKQIPNFDQAILQRCKEQSIDTVYDIMSLEDEDRDKVLQLKDDKLYQVAEFVNKYPNIDIHYTLDLDEPIVAGEPKEITIVLERDEELEDLNVVAKHYPFTKEENWWVIIGDSSTKQLYSIKKTVIKDETQELKMSFTIPNEGEFKLGIWCMCDSYIDADKEVELNVKVSQ